MSESPHLIEQRRRLFGRLILMTAVLVAFGIVGNGAYWCEALGRIPPWELPGWFLCDTLALALFVRAYARWMQAPLADRESVPNVWRLWWWTVIPMGLGMFLDTGYGCMKTLAERKIQRDTAVAVPGQVLSVAAIPRSRVKDEPLRTQYVFRFRYQDSAGRPHVGTAWIELSEGEDGADCRLDPGVVDALRAGQVPVPITVRYDPDWPPRSWVGEPGPVMHAEVVFVSIGCLGVQGAFWGAVIVWFGRAAGEGRVPWWHDMLDGAPFLAEAIVLAVLAGFAWVSWFRGGPWPCW